MKLGDFVVLEDPQVAGLAPELAGSRAVVVWRSHVETEETNKHVEAASDRRRIDRFGLGVTEGLLKSRPVVATEVGGHKDQIEHGRTLLADQDTARDMVAAGRERVRRRFLGDSHFLNWTSLPAEITKIGR